MDNFIGKIFKGFYREHSGLYMISSTKNENGQTMPLSKELCEKWVVKTWGAVGEKPIQKAWTFCG